INDLETEFAYQDIISVVEEAGDYLDIIIVPKVKSAKDVWWVDVLLSQIEKRLQRPRRIGLEVLIEEVEAMLNVEEIARASARLEAIIFGHIDYSASQGIDPTLAGNDLDTYPGDLWHYARNKVTIAARAAGIDAIDGPYLDFKNPEGYRRECTRSKVLGMVGKWAIHPNQIEIASDVFSPSQQEVDRARKLDALYTEAQAQGSGAVAYEGKLIDVAVVRSARNIIQKADLIGI
ncbi:MAG TPA: CoA ester lyase, partial [Ktedonobacteraceae bacterium]|nr:CoA ester lyase [Ktedonobacteraceae bacterium]